MIASLAGTVAAKGDRFLVLETGGLGYRVYVTGDTLRAVQEGSTLRLFTYHHVAEQADDLFGFPSLADVEFFEALLGIAGVGPKTALGVMSVAKLSELQSAIQSKDATILTKVSGIGKKTAERIVLELHGKVESEEIASLVSADDGTVIDALVALGYARTHARDAVRALPADVTGVSNRVREALKNLGGHGRT